MIIDLTEIAVAAVFYLGLCTVALGLGRWFGDRAWQPQR